MGYGPIVICALLILCAGCSNNRDQAEPSQNQPEFTLVIKNIEPKLMIDQKELSLVSSKTIEDRNLMQQWLKFFPIEAKTGEQEYAVGFSARAALNLKLGEETIRSISIDEDLAIWCNHDGPSHFTDDSFPAFFAEQMKASP